MIHTYMYVDGREGEVLAGIVTDQVWDASTPTPVQGYLAHQ